MFDFIILILCILIFVKVSRLKEVALFNAYTNLPSKNFDKRGNKGKNVSK